MKGTGDINESIMKRKWSCYQEIFQMYDVVLCGVKVTSKASDNRSKISRNILSTLYSRRLNILLCMVPWTEAWFYHQGSSEIEYYFLMASWELNKNSYNIFQNEKCLDIYTEDFKVRLWNNSYCRIKLIILYGH